MPDTRHRDSEFAREPLLAALHSVGVQRNGRWLVKDIDLAVHRGEVVSLIGPNGSGKTTVTKVLANSINPDVGTVERAKGIRIGYVPQKINIDSTLPITVRRLMNVPQQIDDRKIDEALDRLDIRPLRDSPVQRLSGGEFQRALFARALLRNPDLLILDEPAQGLDFQGEAKLYRQISDIREQMNCGILLVCHDLHVVMAQTDTVICMNVHICCTGSPTQVKSDEAYLSLFGHQEDEHSHAVYTHTHNHSHHLDGSVGDP